MEPQAPFPYPQPQRTSGVAIASLVTSLLGIGLAGVICGHIALSQIKRSAGALGGKGLAIAGLVIGYVGVLIWLLIAVALVLPVLFVGSQAYKRSADRAACILNQRNVQQAVRAHQNTESLAIGAPIDWKEIFGPAAYMREPVCPAGGTYTYSSTIPAVGVQVVSCSHAHAPELYVPKDVTDW